MSADKITEICEQSWEKYKSDCSGFVKEVVNSFGVELEGDANTIVDYLSSSIDWIKLSDGVEAANKAQSGTLVIAGLKGYEQSMPSVHGHVVVIVKGALAKNKYPTAYWGSYNSVGKKNTTLNYAWTESDRDKVHYFAKK